MVDQEDPVRISNRRVLAPLLLVAFSATLAFGEEEDPALMQGIITDLQLIKEEESVSIASRYEQPISQAPSNVYVITDEDIRQSGATDIPTILRRIPGLEVMQTTGADFNVSVRGNNQLDANKLQVMIDGRSIYIDSQGTVFWKLLPVTLPEIKRIEVLKGPASVLYGFNAFDGIINIVTKSPEEMKGTTLQFGGGELGTITASAIQAGKVDKFGYRLSLGWNQNQEWRNRDALAFRSYLFNVHTEYALSSESRLKVSGGLVDSNRFDGPLHQSTSITSNTPQQGYSDVVYERQNFFLRAWWMGYSSTSFETPTAFGNTIQFGLDRDLNPITKWRQNTYNLEAQHAIDLGKANRLIYGINYRHNAVSGNILNTFSREDRLGLYVQDEWKFTPALMAVAGVRYDLDTFINPTVSPRLALLYHPAENHTFRAAFSVAYRPPTIAEEHLDVRTVVSFPPPAPSPPPTSTLGSSNLTPEQITSYEIGYQGWYWQHRLRVRADLFFNHLSDLIGFQSASSPSNTGEADIYGGEAGAEFLATSWLTGFANFSYQELGQTFTGDVQRGAPRFKWNAGMRGEWDNGLNGEIIYHYYGATTYPITALFQNFASLGVVPPNPRVGSYNLLNLRGGYKFWQQKAVAGYLRTAEVAVSVFNALNDTHKEHPLGDTIGSRVMGWLTVRF